MRGMLASLVVAVALLAAVSSEASAWAWTCRAAGLSGTAWARSWNIIERCWRAGDERMSALPVCTILWCGDPDDGGGPQPMGPDAIVHTREGWVDRPAPIN
jgi:hypothetical protein